MASNTVTVDLVTLNDAIRRVAETAGANNTREIIAAINEAKKEILATIGENMVLATQLQKTMGDIQTLAKAPPKPRATKKAAATETTVTTTTANGVETSTATVTESTSTAAKSLLNPYAHWRQMLNNNPAAKDKYLLPVIVEAARKQKSVASKPEGKARTEAELKSCYAIIKKSHPDLFASIQESFNAAKNAKEPKVTLEAETATP